ncbi:25234_t:CDS:1, partial [Gigaspora rosea]
QVMVNVDNMTEQPTPSNSSKSPNIEQNLRDKLTMNNPFLRQTPDKIILTNSKDTVMKTTTVQIRASYTRT